MGTLSDYLELRGRAMNNNEKGTATSLIPKYSILALMGKLVRVVGGSMKKAYKGMAAILADAQSFEDRIKRQSGYNHMPTRGIL